MPMTALGGGKTKAGYNANILCIVYQVYSKKYFQFGLNVLGCDRMKYIRINCVTLGGSLRGVVRLFYFFFCHLNIIDYDRLCLCIITITIEYRSNGC